MRYGGGRDSLDIPGGGGGGGGYVCFYICSKLVAFSPSAMLWALD
jgi:hypothetical protein